MRKCLLLVLLIMAPSATHAGTNFPALKDYPAPDCVKPGDKPVMGKDAPKVVDAGGVSITTGGRDVKGYNERVGAYNAALGAYTRCMNAYVDNAQADMNAIHDRVNQAVAADKAP
jgi:hypothetical protein